MVTKWKCFLGRLTSTSMSDNLTALNIDQIADPNLFAKKYSKLKHIHTDDHLCLLKTK